MLRLLGLLLLRHGLALPQPGPDTGHKHHVPPPPSPVPLPGQATGAPSLAAPSAPPHTREGHSGHAGSHGGGGEGHSGGEGRGEGGHGGGGGGEDGHGGGESGHGGGEGGHSGGEGGHGGSGGGDGAHGSRGEGTSGGSDAKDVVEDHGAALAAAVAGAAALDDDGDADGTVFDNFFDDDDDDFAEAGHQSDVPQQAVDSVVLVLILATFGLTFVYFQVLEHGMAPPWGQDAEPQQAPGLLCFSRGCFGRDRGRAAWCKAPSGWNPLGGTYLDSAALPQSACPPSYE